MLKNCMFVTVALYLKTIEEVLIVGMSLEMSLFSKMKDDSMTGQIREPKHCGFRFSQIEKIYKISSSATLSGLVAQSSQV